MNFLSICALYVNTTLHIYLTTIIHLKYNTYKVLLNTHTIPNPYQRQYHIMRKYSPDTYSVFANTYQQILPILPRNKVRTRDYRSTATFTALAMR